MSDEYELFHGTEYDASDEQAIEDAAEKSETREKALLYVTERLMSDYEGRRWLWEKMAFCNIHGNVVVSGDIQATYFNLGMENVGKMFLAESMSFPKLYMQMAEEAQERRMNGL